MMDAANPAHSEALLRVMRDQPIVVPQDSVVWEPISEWANVPSNTASADVDWEQAWRFTVQKMAALVAEVESLRAREQRLHEALEQIAQEEELKREPRH